MCIRDRLNPPNLDVYLGQDTKKLERKSDRIIKRHQKLRDTTRLCADLTVYGGTILLTGFFLTGLYVMLLK